MKISIITAVYNRNKTIKRAILSIKEQMHKNIELIIVDGGSNDGTVDAIKSLLDENDTFISESDDGIYDALNKGVTLASGEVIAFLHSDDIYFNNKVLSDVAEGFADKSIDVVYGDVSFFHSKDSLKIIRKYKSDNLSRINLAWGKMPVTVTVPVVGPSSIFVTEIVSSSEYFLPPASVVVTTTLYEDCVS